MNLSDNAVALRAFSKAIEENLVGEPDQGYRSFQQFLLDSADEIDTLRVRLITLRAAFHVNMVLAHPAMSHAEIDKAIDRAIQETPP